jgi:competence protein ComEC
VAGFKVRSAAPLPHAHRQLWRRLSAVLFGGLRHPLASLSAARSELLLWAPIAVSFGIGGYFLWPAEPSAQDWWGAGALALVGLVLRWRGGDVLQSIGAIVFLIAVGFLWMSLRAHSVAAPVLSYRYYGAIEGRIVALDRSFSDGLRLTLDQVVLENTSPQRTPARVRVALHGAQGHILPEAGMRVILTGHLAPPEGAVAPGGFDFQRMAWFARLGAVGYTRSPVLMAAPAQEGAAGLWITRLRLQIAQAVRGRIAGESGAFAAAVLAGDRSGMSRATQDALRASNLSHLLAISGLHMGLLTGFVFATLRYGLAAFPALALRLPSRKIAAVLAFFAAGFYLALSGGNVATQRAFVQVGVMLFAVVLDRRALTLRSVALAAMIILTLEPESLIEPGFQMSFAATTALVAGYRAIGRWHYYWPGVFAGQGRLPGWLVPVVGLFLSSLIAGFATAPVAAAHFNRVPEYGLVANMLAVPAMGLVVMPMAVLAGVLAPLGLAAPALMGMDLGTRWILAVAGWVAALDGAVITVPTPPWFVLPMLALGALLTVLARGAGRSGGGVLAVAAIWIWAVADRPALLISGDGAMVGLATESGRALSKPLTAGFVVQSWLEDDGDAASQAQAHSRWPGPVAQGRAQASFAGYRLYHFTGTAAPKAVEEACIAGAIVVTDKTVPTEGECLLFDAKALRASGAIAINQAKDGTVSITRARAVIRLWSGRG